MNSHLLYMRIDDIQKLGGPSRDTRDLITDLIENETQSLGTAQGLDILYYIFKNQDTKLLNLLDDQLKHTPEIMSFIESIYQPPQKIMADYFPHQDKVSTSNEGLILGAEFEVEDSKKDLLRQISSSSDSSFSVKMEFILAKNSFLKYETIKESISDNVSRFLTKHKPLIGIALSGAILFSSVSKYLEKNSETIEKSNIQQSQKNALSNSAFFNSFSEALGQIERMDNAKNLIISLNSISQDELAYIDQLRTPDMSDTQAQFKDIITENLAQLIMSAQNERIKFKTQKPESLMTNEKMRKLASEIVDQSIESNIDYRVYASIIMQESKFDSGVPISPSGDVAIAQINYKIWKPEFDKLGLEFDKAKLQSSEKYSIWAMGVILSTLKQRYADKDPYWYARYNYGHGQRKAKYASLVNSHFTNFNQQQVDHILDKLDKVLIDLNKTDYKNQAHLDHEKIDSLVSKLIQLKFQLGQQSIPTRIVSN